MSSLSLPFDVSRGKANEFSKKANLRIDRSKPNLRTTILMWLEDNPQGATREQLSAILGIGYTTVSGRVTELKILKLVVEDGEDKTSSNCAAAIVKAARREQ